MAANQGKKIRKLYFDVALPATRESQVFACTQYAAGTAGDRYGALIQALEACTGSTPAGIRQQRAVSAWFQPSAAVDSDEAVPVMPAFTVRFVQPTSNVANASSTAGNDVTLTGLAYLTVGGVAVPNKIGHEGIFSATSGILRHFAVQVAKGVGASVTLSVHGVLYVQRQHSIEV